MEQFLRIGKLAPCLVLVEKFKFWPHIAYCSVLAFLVIDGVQLRGGRAGDGARRRMGKFI